MAPLNDAAGRDRILDAALALLEAGGLDAVTTNALARAAKCSKNTLYALFADRGAILSALVARRAGALNAALDGIEDAAAPREALVEAGARLLDLLTSPASLAINRAALGDASGELSRLLVAAGRDRSAPKIGRLLDRLRADGHLAFPDAQTAYRCFYGLLIADRQILALHRVPGARPDAEARRGIAGDAVAGLFTLFAPR